MNAPKPAFDYTRPDVVNGGFAISFDRDHTGPLISITCPQGHFFRLWEKGTDTDRPVIYGWATKEDEQNSNEPVWQIVTPRSGRAITRIDVKQACGDKALIIVERSLDDADAVAADFFYTIHTIDGGLGDWAVKAAEDADQGGDLKYDTWAEACIAMSQTLIELGKTV